MSADADTLERIARLQQFLAQKANPKTKARWEKYLYSMEKMPTSVKANLRKLHLNHNRGILK